MNIPPLNVSVTKAAIDGRVVDVIDYDEYIAHKDMYVDRQDVAIPTKTRSGKEILLPVKGKYPESGVRPMNPGVYDGGSVSFFVDPAEEFVERFVSKNTITMSNTTDIAELIKAGEESKRLDEPFITTPDNVTTIPIRENDQPEMIALKLALNAKHIDIDSYAGRFGDNYPNDKRQLKSNTATLKIIKRFCDNCDMDAILIFKDKGENVPNPMNKEVAISLTEPITDELIASYYNNSSISSNYDDSEDDLSEYEDD